jgi:UDP-glucose 4-epimerase
MRQGIAPVIYGDGLQNRDFIHVSDVVQANLIVMEHPKATARTFNVARGIATTLLDIINEINYLTDQNLQPAHKEVRPGDIRHSLADNTALKALGWSPSISISEGLAELLKTSF